MKHFHSFGFVAAFALLELAALPACSSSSPSGSTTGKAGMGGADASAGAAGSTGGSAGGGGVTADSGAAGNTSEAGTTGSDAASDGPASDGGAGQGPDGAASTGDAGPEVAPLATAAMVKASCSMYAAGTMALSAADFCTLFQATCVAYIDYEPLTGCAAGPTLWAPVYNKWTTSQQDCRSEYLCKAAAGSASTYCHDAQGFGNECN